MPRCPWNCSIIPRFGSMDIEIHHSFAESTHVGKGIIHWFLTWFLWEDIQKSKMSGPCRTCCSVVLLGRSTKGSGIRLSRRFAGLTAGLSTYHVGACQTCESQKSRFEGLKIRDRYSDFFSVLFLQKLLFALKTAWRRDAQVALTENGTCASCETKSLWDWNGIYTPWLSDWKKIPVIGTRFRPAATLHVLKCYRLALLASACKESACRLP